MSDGNGPPVLIGEKVWWLGSGSGLPKRGVVRWIGRLPEIGPDWALGIELEEGLPYGGVDGTWRGRVLFKCKPKHGLIVPSDRVLAHQTGGGSLDTARRAVALLPFQQQVAPPRLKRHQERSLLLDRHADFRSVHLEAVQIHRRVQQDQIVSLVLGQTSGSTGDVLSRGMSRTEAAASVVPRPRRTESLAARKEKTNSGLFSFLRWFRKENKTDRGEERSSFSNPGSPVLRRSDSAITGSVDTLFSTATATSFAYVQPECYKPFGEASEPEKWIYPGPETSTYRNRIRTRDELRRLNENLSLRKKYNLYASGSLGRSLDEIFDDRSSDSVDRLQELSASCSSTLARKKRKAPAPPARNDSLTSTGCDSLPTTLSKESLDDFKLHRRTVSESAKYKKKPYHVKGKRKAPPPPNSRSQERESSNDLEHNDVSTLRKKRKAPPPPPIVCQKENVIHVPKESTLDIIESDKLRSESSHHASPSTSRNPDLEVESISSTDTLRLERGILKPNKMDREYVEPQHAPTSPVSPRPWYKRPQSSGSSPKQGDWKKKETKSIEDWMLESGFPRRSQGLPSDSKFSIFGKTDRPEDKRRSQISILTNISELDREAAEIIQRGKEREKSLLASYNAKYYVDPAENEPDIPSRLIDEGSQTDAVPRKATAKELITLFNSITNVSRITLNSHFVTQEDNIVYKKGNVEKVSSVKEELSCKSDILNSNKADVSNGFTQKERQLAIMNDVPMPGPSRHRALNGIEKRITIQPSFNSSSEGSRISRVTIEELDEYDSEKNKSQLSKENTGITYQTPTPIITETSEPSMKSSSGSTICSSLLNDSSSSLSSGSSSGAKIRSSNLFSHSPLQKKLSVWTCSRCTLENPRWRLTCEACDMWRPTVCDYKLCKKSSLSDDQPDAVNSNGKPRLFERKSNSVVKELDKETTNFIRNGQILENLASQRIISGNREQRISKLNSPKIIKKELSTEIPSNSEGSVGNTNEIIRAECDNVPKSSTSSYTADDEQAEVVRKARLAFFNKTDTNIDDAASSSTDKESANNMDNISKVITNDKLKLRELLKEMKNSLPKQKKLLNSASSVNQSVSQSVVKTTPTSKPIMTKHNSLGESSAIVNTESISEFNFEQGQDMVNSKSTDCKQNNVSDQSIIDDDKLVNSDGKVKNGSKQTSLLNKPDKPPNLKSALVDESVKSNYKPSNSRRLSAGSKPVIVDTIAKSGGDEVQPGVADSKNNVILKEETSNVNKAGPSVDTPIKVAKETKIETANAQNQKSENLKNNKKAEAILIKSEIIIEETKIKKKPEKVSSSAQTSTKVLSLDDNSKGSVKNNEVIIPVTTEEYILDKNGALASNSIRVEPVKIDVKKFELMRPRDFTSVKPPSVEQVESKTANNLEQSAAPSTSSSGSSLHDLNLQIAEPVPGPSTSKAGEGGTYMGTVALNRLLRRLESAISGGQHDVAALLAKELARLKVPCSVVRQSTVSSSPPDILINVLVEDKTTQKGPIPLKVKPTTTLADLKRKMEKEHDIPSHLQRWFIDKKLASDDQANMKQLGIQGPSSPVFLYLIAPEIAEKEVKSDENKEKVLSADVLITENNEIPNNDVEATHTMNESATLPSTQSLDWRCKSCRILNKRDDKTCKQCGLLPSGGSVSGQSKQEAGDKNSKDVREIEQQEPQPSTSSQTVERERKENYERLVALEKDELVVSIVPFECPICFIECVPPEGVVLRECLHSFCRACLSKTVEYSEEAEVKCPFRDDTYTCNSILLEREIKALVTPEVYEEHLAKSIAQAETKIANAFHCKTPDCKGWCIYEDNVNLFKCPVCLHSNCLTCQAIHDGLDCKQYQEQLNQDSEVNIEAKRTKDMLQEMVDRGEAMPCPRCKVVLMKKWGCDWLRCSMCKTEICWVTRGPRWGPNGKGDTSGGCQCGVNGVKCHPKCNYCH